MLTALIAQEEIKKNKPEIFEKISTLINILEPFTKNGDYPFIEAATYPDDIKYLHWNAFDNWHFNDNYWSVDGTPVNIPSDPTNIVWAIENCKSTLMSTKTSRVDDKLGKSFMLFFLIHLVGDIH